MWYGWDTYIYNHTREVITGIISISVAETLAFYDYIRCNNWMWKSDIRNSA